MAGIEVFADSSRGVYIPQFFAESVRADRLSGVTPEDMATLKAGPDGADYWDAWASVLDSARMTDDAGRVWGLYQDGDLFAVAEDATPAERAALMGEGE